MSPIFTSLGVSQADLTSYIERLSGYIIAILVLLIAMIVVMVAAHKAKKGVRHVIRWQAGSAFVAIVAVLANIICYGPMYNNVSSILNAKKVELADSTTKQSRKTVQKVGAAHKKVIHYRNVLPQDEIFRWDDMGHFHLDQYILMHSVIYRTDMLKLIQLYLPKQTFYVDNMYVYYPLPHVRKIYYMDVDFYRYFIGREDQSVNEKVIIKRLDQQIFVTKTMIDMYQLKDIGSKKLR